MNVDTSLVAKSEEKLTLGKQLKVIKKRHVRAALKKMDAEETERLQAGTTSKRKHSGRYDVRWRSERYAAHLVMNTAWHLANGSQASLLSLVPGYNKPKALRRRLRALGFKVKKSAAFKAERKKLKEAGKISVAAGDTSPALRHADGTIESGPHLV